MVLPLYAICSVVVTLLLVSLLGRKQRIPKGLRPIPSPRGLPLVGNPLQLKSQPQGQLRQWAAAYGELFQIQIGWENWIFVNSPAAVKEIFNKQSALTPGRAPMPVLLDLVSGGMRSC